MLLYNFFYAFFLTIFCLIFFEVENNFSSSANRFTYKTMIAVMVMNVIFTLHIIKKCFLYQTYQCQA